MDVCTGNVLLGQFTSNLQFSNLWQHYHLVVKEGHWLSCLLEWSVDPIQTGLAQAHQVPMLLLWNLCMQEQLHCVPILGASWYYVTSLYYYFYHHHDYYVVLVSTGLFFLVLLLNQGWSPPLRPHVSDCITYRIVCHVPSLACPL